HLDLMRVWERALRRAGLPLAYSGGYNPRPKLQLARALPLGHVGEEEILDAWLEEPIPVEDIATTTMPVLPNGLTIKQVHQVDPKAPAMQTQVVATVYRVTVEWDEEAQEVEARVKEILSVDELPHERRGKRYNLRPLIEDLRVIEVAESTVTLRMQLSARPGATGRPEAVVDVLGMGTAFARYYRERLVLRSDAS
ncbi:MAG: TIGR03936 family radical SAM-associated protein, partial [Anaerolineae bacterium]|nr:TIGR03936 family radical SAM-associated protein [Anaerolineae bacterium]